MNCWKPWLPVFLLALLFGCESGGDSNKAILQKIEADLTALRAQIGALENSLASVAATLSRPTATTPTSPSPSSPRTPRLPPTGEDLAPLLESLGTRLQDLEARLEQGEVKLVSARSLAQAGLRALDPQERETMAREHHETAVDRALSTVERIKASIVPAARGF